MVRSPTTPSKPSAKKKFTGRSSTPSKSTAKKRKKQPLLNLYKNDEAALAALKEKIVGKRLLIRCEDLYKDGCVPDEMEGLLFQYTVTTVNDDLKKATLEFDNTCIEEDGTSWRNYIDTKGQNDLTNYNLSGLTDAHELFNCHLGYVNKAASDKEVEAEIAENEKYAAAAEDLSDIEHKFNGGMDGYDALLLEFESVGTAKQHVIKEGANTGKGK